ncbi:MAG: hypothetical protein N2167_04870 [Flavobacteriales bacterium]|nr:hypothetical protein [Flavobacteriales bacterium]
MSQANPSYDSSKYLHVLTPSVSFRKLPSGIKFYFQYQTRADREMLSQLKQKILAVGACGLLFIPLGWFGLGSPAWPFIFGAFFLWMSWMLHMGWQRFLKMHGMETLYVTYQKVELKRCVNWGNRRWNLSRNILYGNVSFTILNQSVKQQSFLGMDRIQVIKLLHPSPASSSPEIGLKVSDDDFQKILPLIQSIKN